MQLCALVSPSACNLDNLGTPPPPAEIYLPTGLALSTQTSDSAPRLLYLISSNFDLLYNSGSVQAYDLDRVDAAIAACPVLGSGKCEIDPKSVLLDEVLVPSHATSLGFSADHSRLFVATRTDPSLSYIDLDENAAGEDILRCAQTDRRCSDTFKRGNDPTEGGPRRLTLPIEPVGLVALPASEVDAPGAAEATPGNYVIVAHRAGQVSLFYEDASGPQLIDVLGGQPLEPTGVTFDPVTRLAYLSVFARNSTLGLSRLLGRVGVAPDPDPRRAFLYDVGATTVDGVAAQRDTRGVSLNPLVPGQLLVVGRDPAALLSVDVSASLNGAAPPGSAPTRRIVTMSAGPSRLAIASLGERTLAAISCFDSQEVFVIDVATGDVLGIVHNLNGPFELAIDSVRRRLYVADFRASVVRVLDLAPIVLGELGGRTDISVIATLGLAKVVQELQ